MSSPVVEKHWFKYCRSVLSSELEEKQDSEQNDDCFNKLVSVIMRQGRHASYAITCFNT
jgi:hypothetical protein